MSLAAAIKIGDETEICKYFCRAYCKYKESFRFDNPKERCTVKHCKKNQCLKRHPTLCVYNENCC